MGLHLRQMMEEDLQAVVDDNLRFFSANLGDVTGSVLDLIKPGMNGFQVLEEKAHDPAIAAIPVIIISSRDPAAGQISTTTSPSPKVQGSPSATRSPASMLLVGF